MAEFASVPAMANPVARVERIARMRGDVTELRPRVKRPRAPSGPVTPVRLSYAFTTPFRKAADAAERFGPFLIREQIGEGGMARVHRAELVGAAGFRKSIALKRMRTELTEDADSVAAFVHEAQLASRLHNPHIADAYDLGKIDGTYYIAMEYVPGPTLAAVMAQSRRAAGLVPLPIVLEILIQLCDALEHAHDLRDAGDRPLELVHRDVSPANVILATSGTVKLIDFGIAKDRSARADTEAGVIKGKHAYIAPEYTYGQLDRRADLFALGVIAHELLTGRRLFLADNDFATLYNVRTKPIPPPSRYQPIIPHALDDIVLTALQRDPELRWQNAGAMRSALAGVAREMGFAITSRDISDWIEWAFRQEPRSDTAVGRLLDELEPSISIEDDDRLVIETISLLQDPDVAPPADLADTRALRRVVIDDVETHVIPRANDIVIGRPAIDDAAHTVPRPRPARSTAIVRPMPAPAAPMFSAIIERQRPSTSRTLILLLALALGAAAVTTGIVDVAWWRATLGV